MPLKKIIILIQKKKQAIYYFEKKPEKKRKKKKKERGHFMSIFYSIMTCVAARCVKNQKLSGFIMDVITAIIWFQYGV